jgi:hypothetical protein
VLALKIRGSLEYPLTCKIRIITWELAGIKSKIVTDEKLALPSETRVLNVGQSY